MEGDAGKLFRYDMAKQCNRPEEEVPSDSVLEKTFSRLLVSFENLPTLDLSAHDVDMKAITSTQEHIKALTQAFRIETFT